MSFNIAKHGHSQSMHREFIVLCSYKSNCALNLPTRSFALVDHAASREIVARLTL
jgi:hypothetical protein